SGTFALRVETLAQRLREIGLDTMPSRRHSPDRLAFGLGLHELEHAPAVLVLVLLRIERRFENRQELLRHRDLALLERLALRRAELGRDDHLLRGPQRDEHRDAVVRRAKRPAIL